jgi:hypothetical protein
MPFLQVFHYTVEKKSRRTRQCRAEGVTRNELARSYDASAAATTDDMTHETGCRAE